MKKTTSNLTKTPMSKIDSKKKEKPSSCTLKKQSEQEMDHDYAMEASSLNKREREADSTPTTPSKTPLEKKTKSTESDMSGDISLRDLMKAILTVEQKMDTYQGSTEGKLEKVDEKLAELKQQAVQNNAMIANLTKAVEFNSEEVKECKSRVKDLEKQNERMSKENVELKQRLAEQERYRMRWSIRVIGMEEKTGEDIRQQVVHMLKRVVPDLESKLEDAVDVVHRLGKKTDRRHRPVVVLFAHRRVKEEVWRKSKDSTFLKNIGVKLAEMLPKEDLEERRRLWPQIEEARKAGKVAYFRGPFSYIEGRWI